MTATSSDGQKTTATAAYTVLAAAKLADMKVAITGPTQYRWWPEGGAAIYWTASSIAPGASVTYAVTLKVAASARGSVLFAVASASRQIKDPNYANNAAATAVTLGAPTGHMTALLARTTLNPLALGRRHPTVAPLTRGGKSSATRAVRAALMDRPDLPGRPDTPRSKPPQVGVRVGRA